TTPINELIETAYSVEEKVGVQLGPVVVNGVDLGPPVPTVSDDPDLAAAARFRNLRRAAHEGELRRLSTDLALAQIVLPQLPVAGVAASDLAALADALDAQIATLAR
ncbi:MAG: putative anion transporting ATPase, partial [Acidimicrobiales bacterium]|nr:putative anion transporting ATPase [Acidimicrobiales bacterium]